MCELCEKDPQKRDLALKAELRKYESLKEVSIIYYQLYKGELDPHSETMSEMMPKIKNVIKFLVNDW